MNKQQVAIELKRLYAKYHVDSSQLDNLSDVDIAKGTKGHLAYLQNNKNSDYSKEDSEIIKEIAYFFA